MGSAREWAAEKEDETTVCRHGVESAYFEKCQCRGCKLDREIGAEITETLCAIKEFYSQKHSDKIRESLLAALQKDLEELKNGN